MYKFNASFRKSVAAVAEELGLEFISTPRQVNRGTLMFNDPQSNVKYAMYESGYVRRLVPTSHHWSSSQTIGDKGHQMYQLNKTSFGFKTTTFNGREYTSYQKIRIMANPEEQLGIMVKAIANWRNR
jgi:hypothetical protein